MLALPADATVQLEALSVLRNLSFTPEGRAALFKENGMAAVRLAGCLCERSLTAWPADPGVHALLP